MNKKDIINFIRLTNPIGEYFEELDGTFIGKDKFNKLMFLSNEIYHKEFVLDLNLEYELIRFISDLNFKTEFPNFQLQKCIKYLNKNKNYLVYCIDLKWYYYYNLNNDGKYNTYFNHTSGVCIPNDYYTFAPIRFEPIK